LFSLCLKIDASQIIFIKGSKLFSNCSKGILEVQIKINLKQTPSNVSVEKIKKA